ncbi:MAG: serine hydrolase, partial [Bacteroidales bacterium]|nr:serine hydrolase [Bacteroidales bacterium]
MSAPYMDHKISSTQAEGSASDDQQTPILNKLQEFTNLGDKSLIMKTTFLSIVLSMIVLSGITQDKQTDYSEALKLIEVWLDAQRDYDRVPGMSVIIVDDQEVLWSGAFGMANLENHVKATPSTLYSICSISKLFTSVAIMKLYDEGKLRLDDKVDDLLP